jgi:uncharacterized protein YggE
MGDMIDNREIVVKGIGHMSVPPDLIAISMRLEVVKLEYNDAMHHATRLLSSLREALVLAGYNESDLKTTDFNISSEYEDYQDSEDNWREKFVGFSCVHDLRLEFDLDIEKLGETLSAITNCMANPKLTILFSVKDSNVVSQQLLKSAVENAKQKAEILATAAGVSLGVIKHIDYNWNDIHLYSKTSLQMVRAKGRRDVAEPMSISLNPQDIEASDSVTVIWQIA